MLSPGGYRELHVSEMSEMRMEKDKGQITKTLLVYAKDCEFHPG